jgi:hypothetical protein
MKRKWLAVGIILLFIGVAVAPSINSAVVKASDDNDLVEVTSQACGIQGFANTTVKLTKEQYQNLEQYLVDFRARLNQTTNREEAVPIFKEAVVELNKYGLLPKGMSVEKAQKFVISEQKQDINHRKKSNMTARTLLFNLIAGRAEGYFIGLGLLLALLPYGIFSFIESILQYVSGGILLTLIVKILLLLFDAVLGLVTFFTQNFPFALLNYGFLVMFQDFGWIFSIGLFGIVSLNHPYAEALIYGFTGIKIHLPDTSFFYLGSSLLLLLDIF